MPRFKAGGRLLEIGCGGGGFLSIMRLLGWRVCGTDHDPVAAAVAREVVGCEIHVGTIEDAGFDEGQFDAIVASHVIEHAYDPQSFVSRSGRLLARGGVMTVLTPNFGSLGHKMFGSDWYCLDPPRHLCLFTPKSLQSLFTETGLFRDVQTRTITPASGLAISRRHAVRATGNFLGDAGNGARPGDLAFRALEAAGNPSFRWGQENPIVALQAF